MKQFNLSEWLKDKNRKICTRDGREVTIEKTDIHIHGMSHMILGKYGDIYEIWNSNGRINYTGSDCNLDLFFADEKDELTDFEKAVEKNIPYKIPIDMLKSTSQQLLELARKESLQEFRCREELFYKNGFEKGKEDALKDLPKWKKMTKREQNYLAYGYLSHDGYYLNIQELKDKLPKEE